MHAVKITMATAHPSNFSIADAQLRAGDVGNAVALLRQSLADPLCAVRLREWAVAERRLDMVPPALQALSNAGAEGSVSAAIDRQLRQQPEAALAILQDVIRSNPELATAHHHLGRALQNLGRGEEAAQAIRQALQLQPGHAEAWYSLAHVERARGNLQAAVDAYKAALNYAPALRAALLNLGITLCALDQPDAALEPLDKLLKLDPQHVDAWVNRGLCLHILGRMDLSQQSYERALQLAPGHALAHFYLGCLLNEQMATAPARAHLESALIASPADPDVLTELVGLLEQTNDLTSAEERVRGGLAHAPMHPGLNLEAARLARRQGRLEEARGGLLRLDARTLPARLAQQYWFERGQLHDRAKEFDQAMAAFEQGNQLAMHSPRRRHIDREAFPRHCDDIAHWLQRGAVGAGSTHADPLPQLGFRPAFLVGFPRSGTTLLDTMLDAHPDVASIEERATIEIAVDELGNYPELMKDLNSASIAKAHATYAHSVRSYVPIGFSGLLLDKLPLRMLRVPFIRRLFPDAPILFAVRHPCDVVLSNVMQQYVPNEAFVHFDTIADAARMYDRIMRVWRQILDTLPIQPHWVRYESLVTDPEGELAAACAALKLEIRAEMLDPAARMKGRERIQTNSYQQVAEPIYRRASGRWRHYEAWLKPVLPLLQPHIEWLGYEAR
jgi:tetratricopeptide (TPR) repeat protein